MQLYKSWYQHQKRNKIKIKGWNKSNENEKNIQRIDDALLEEYKHDDYEINESQDSQSNNKANLDAIEDLNISSN